MDKQHKKKETINEDDLLPFQENSNNYLLTILKIAALCSSRRES